MDSLLRFPHRPDGGLLEGMRLPDDTEITPNRIRLIQVVAATFAVTGVVNLVEVFLRLANLGLNRGVSLAWIGDIIIGLGLLSFSRGAYITARWWVSLKLLAYGARLIWLIVIGVRISQLHDRSSSLLAVFEKGMTPVLLLLLGYMVLAVWQLWVLNRRYTRSIFGYSLVSADSWHSTI
jgi:hypothetical protein